MICTGLGDYSYALLNHVSARSHTSHWLPKCSGARTGTVAPVALFMLVRI